VGGVRTQRGDAQRGNDQRSGQHHAQYWHGDPFGGSYLAPTATR
jgi:hypothetical protein